MFYVPTLVPPGTIFVHTQILVIVLNVCAVGTLVVVLVCKLPTRSLDDAIVFQSGNRSWEQLAKEHDSTEHNDASKIHAERQCRQP